MPIKFGSKTTTANTTPPSAPQQPADLGALGTGHTPTHDTTPPPSAPPSGPAKPPVNPATYLKTGTQQADTVRTVKAQQDMRAKLRGGAREFYLNAGQFARLYFLDGELTGPSQFDTPMVAVHMLQIGGNWVKFVCLQEIEGDCIACKTDGPPQSVQMFTVINTTPYTIQNGPRKGVTMPARLQLFPANLRTRETLVHKATNRGGKLAGNLFEFRRTTNQASRTGDDIEFIQSVPMDGVLKKYPMLGDIDPKTKKETPTRIIDYAYAYPVITNAELAAMRPDLASQAGWSGPGYDPKAPVAPGTTSSVGYVGDDEIPFSHYPWSLG